MCRLVRIGKEEAAILSIDPAPISENEEDDSYLSTDEVRDRLATLTREQRDRLIVRSQYLVRHQRLLAADLRQEAMVRALDGRRKCRQSWEIVPFLIGVMRSMIRDDHREEAKGRTLALIDDMDVPAFEDDPFHAENLAIDTVDYRRTIASIRDGLKSDPQLLALQEAILEGKQGAELQRRLGVDERGLDALRRRLKRALLRATKNRSRP